MQAIKDEHKVMKNFFNEICALSDSRQLQIVELRQELNAFKKEHEKAMTEW